MTPTGFDLVANLAEKLTVSKKAKLQGEVISLLASLWADAPPTFKRRMRKIIQGLDGKTRKE